MGRLHVLAVLVIGIFASVCHGGGVEIVASRQKAQLFPTRATVPADLFSLNVINLDYGVLWPTVKFSGWRSFESVWTKVEPERARWNLEKLDGQVALALANGVDLMLALQSPPTWASSRPNEFGCCTPLAQNGNRAPPANIEDWRHYVRTIATRYKGKVNYYELWNEPNESRFFSGSLDDLIALNRAAYQELKAVDPFVTVVSSGMSPCCQSLQYLEEYFRKGGAQNFDVLGYHFYVAPKPPEASLEKIAAVRRLAQKYGIKKPLWNTESGWKILNRDRNDLDSEYWAGSALSPELGGAYLARSYLLGWAAGVERSFWYAWGHRSMGMTDYAGKNPNEVAKAFSTLQHWLVGATLSKCSEMENAVWRCDLARGLNGRGAILWAAKGDILLSKRKIDESFHWQEDLSGVRRTNVSLSEIILGASPILFINREWSSDRDGSEI